MVRSRWIGPVFGVAAMTGLAVGQTKAPPAPAADGAAQIITVQEAGKPAQKCKVLKTWTEPDGSHASQVQALDTGELMTIEGASPVGDPAQSRPLKSAVMRVFHWGRGRQNAPSGAPLPPGEDVVISTTINGRPVPPLAPPAPGAPVAQVQRHPVAAPVPPLAPAAPGAERWPSAYTVNSDAGCACAPAVGDKIEPTPGGLPPTRVVERPVIVLPPPPEGVAATAPAKGPLFGRWGLLTGPNKAPAASVTTGAAAKAPAAETDKKTPSAAAKVEISTAHPSDWRESWGKVEAPKAPAASAAPPPPPAAVAVKPKVQAPKAPPPPAAVAVKPKVEALPHAEARADDPLKDPEKYTHMPHTADEVGPKGAAEKDKAVVLNAIVAKQPPAAEKKMDAPAAASPPALVLSPAAAADKAPVAPGMKSVLAAASPELTAAPAAPKPPAAPGGRPQIEAAMGIDPNEPNAFSEGAPAGNISGAPNAFSAPPQAPAAADPQATALAMNAFMAPPQAPAPGAMTHAFPDSSLPTRPPAPAPTGYAPAQSAPVTTAGYHTGTAPDLAALFGVLHESLYPSQREDAAEALGSMDWRLQPQILDVLVEKARRDPAPGVRAECLRSLGRLKANTPPAVEAVKAMRADADPRVRHEADDAYAAITGTAPKAAP